MYNYIPFLYGLNIHLLTKQYSMHNVTNSHARSSMLTQTLSHRLPHHTNKNDLSLHFYCNRLKSIRSIVEHYELVNITHYTVFYGWMKVFVTLHLYGFCNLKYA